MTRRMKDHLSLPLAKMRSLVVLLAALTVCSARPQFREGLHVSPVRGVKPYVIGGTDASPGEFPWQLSLTWSGSHICGATLLSSSRALCAAHCVDGAVASSLAVIAGLLNRNDLTGTQSSDLSSYVKHPAYQVGLATSPNDISILHFSSNISTGGNIQTATLPANDNNNYASTTCEISGWGRTDATNELPNTLQKASIPVIPTLQCTLAMVGLGIVGLNHICVKDPTEKIGACNGDSGGPLNCPDGVTRVVGVTSWVVVDGDGACLPTYPSVYTRVGPYLQWIADN